MSSINKLNSVGEKTEPCGTTFVKCTGGLAVVNCVTLSI